MNKCTSGKVKVGLGKPAGAGPPRPRLLSAESRCWWAEPPARTVIDDVTTRFTALNRTYALRQVYPSSSPVGSSPNPCAAAVSWTRATTFSIFSEPYAGPHWSNVPITTSLARSVASGWTWHSARWSSSRVQLSGPIPISNRFTASCGNQASPRLGLLPGYGWSCHARTSASCRSAGAAHVARCRAELPPERRTLPKTGYRRIG